MLILYYSFWKESDLKSGSQPSYANKLQKVAVLQLVNENKQKVEPHVDEALIRHNIEVLHRENQNIAEENWLIDTRNIRKEKSQKHLKMQFQIFHSQIKIFIKVMMKLAPIFDHWTLNSNIELCLFLGKENCKTKKFWTFLFYSFLCPSFSCSDLAGVGKSNLVKTIHQPVSRLALTGAASINVNGTMIHSAWKLVCRGKLYPLDTNTLATLWNRFSEVELIIIDEISMVSKKVLTKFIST